MSQPGSSNSPDARILEPVVVKQHAAPNVAGLLFIIGAAGALAAADLTLVSTALLSIGGQLSVAPVFLPWIVSAVPLAMAASLIPAGRATDRYGSRAVFLLGIMIFIAASTAAAVVPSYFILILMRAAQGIGAAMVQPAAFALIRSSLPARQARLKAFASMGIGNGIAIVMGPVASGLIVVRVGGRGVFAFDAVVALCIAVTALRVIPVRAAGPGVASRDALGSLLVAVAPTLLLLSLGKFESFGLLSSSAIGCLCSGLACSIFLIIVERRVKAPLLPPALFRARSMCGGCIAAFFIFAAAGCLYVLTGVFLQRVLHMSLRRASAAMMVYGIGYVMAGQSYPRLLRRVSTAAMMVIGGGMIGAGLLSLALLPDNRAGLLMVLPGLAFGGFGAALGILSSLATATAEAADADQGIASSIVFSLSQIGLPTGVTVGMLLLVHPFAGAISPETQFRLPYGAGAAFAVLCCLSGFFLTRRPKP